MRLWLGGFAVVLGMAAPVSADIAIRGARIAEGDLWVLGQVDEPNTTITLDDSYFEKTDQQGRFEFRLGYHPAACTVILKTERQSRVVVIANCGQRGPAGPVGQAGPPGPAGPTGQVGPPGSSGSAAAPAAPLEARQGQGPRLDVSCGQKAALYEAPNGFRIWITRKGLLRSSSSRPQPAQAEVVLQVAIGGQTASLRGPDYTSMVRGGPPQEIEEASRQLINWERLTDALPGAIEIVSDTGSGSLARLTFKECGSAPRAPRPSPAAGADADRPDAPPPRPLPQGALPDGPQLSQP